MKVLIWRSKHGNVMVCARDTEEEGKAWLYLFKCMQDNNYYDCVDGDEVDAYAKAQEGDPKAAAWLLCMRSDRGCEYENVEAEYIKVPE